MVDVVLSVPLSGGLGGWLANVTGCRFVVLGTFPSS